MYKYLKMLQAVVEEIGEVKSVQLYDGDKIWRDGIRIKGETADGKCFELELTVIKAGDTNA